MYEKLAGPYRSLDTLMVLNRHNLIAKSQNKQTHKWIYQIIIAPSLYFFFLPFSVRIMWENYHKKCLFSIQSFSSINFSVFICIFFPQESLCSCCDLCNEKKLTTEKLFRVKWKHTREMESIKRPKIKWSRHNNTFLQPSTPSAARVAWLYVIVQSEFAASTEFSSIFFSINIPYLHF